MTLPMTQVLPPRSPTSIPSAPCSGTGTGTFCGDTSGAVLVLGVALGAAIAAALRHLIEVGDIVQSRDVAQAAADASALENAIWHARGMNTIASINITLGLVVGVFVLWRLALAVSTLTTLIALAASLLEPGGSVALRASSEPLADLLGHERELAGTVAAIASGLGTAQALVAAYTPVLAARAARPFHSQGDATDDRRVETSSAALGRPASLPVEPDRYSLLCALPSDFGRRLSSTVLRVAQTVTPSRSGRLTTSERQARRALGLPESSDVTALVTRISGLADGAAPAAFCAPSGPAVAELRDATRAVLDGAGRGPGAFVTVPQARDAAQRLVHGWRSENGDRESGRPARVRASARNGNLAMRSAAQALDSGIVAHAEMYFDCSEAWTTCAPEALWQLRWTARLRRVRPLPALEAELQRGGAPHPPLGPLPPLASQPIERTPAAAARTRAGARHGNDSAVEASLARFLVEGGHLDSIIH
jgi:hypothetical protein